MRKVVSSRGKGVIIGRRSRGVGSVGSLDKFFVSSVSFFISFFCCSVFRGSEVGFEVVEGQIVLGLGVLVGSSFVGMFVYECMKFISFGFLRNGDFMGVKVVFEMVFRLGVDGSVEGIQSGLGSGISSFGNVFVNVGSSSVIGGGSG